MSVRRPCVREVPGQECMRNSSKGSNGAAEVTRSERAKEGLGGCSEGSGLH